ncbi:class I SAM-dependent methyltransferase [Synechococcus sp. PCC 7336]|uniref:class I SAM-dependent methyltransferase n=1 Tax=Synechococcus sp. PCC 7336 TaxID=195250 RepID=UPI00034CC8A4|nr:methyltransferase domain-containing protein [Synechococcus sp. PCC 7336]
MSADILTEHRRDVLSRAKGQVLEIGFGTGLNLPYYPASVEQLTAIDANPGTMAIARRRLKQAKIPVERATLNGESLPMADASFDTAVSTWTLCSIANVSQALQEVRRVLKPGGELLFIEHGLSPDRPVEVWQNRLNGLQKAIADGCHLNRNIPEIVEAAGLKLTQLESFYADGMPKFVGYSYKGVATKPV